VRVHNFGAGPAALPLPVLERAQSELLDYAGDGMSLMEMSHRSKTFSAVMDAAQANVRSLMEVPEEYEVLFLQGGASLQFAMIPLNLCPEGQVGDYVHTGSWSAKAINEAKVAGKCHVAWDGKDEGYARVPKPEELDLAADAAYVHICTNETIGGIRYPDFPKTDAPLLADMSSEIMSRVVDVSRFGMIYAGAQKNLGPSGLAILVMQKDLIARSPESVPVFLRFTTHAEKGSLYNTPNTWGVYLVMLVTEWLKEQGGVAAMERVNEEKAGLLYGTLDGSDFWKPAAAKDCRSTMNVTWRLASEELEKLFLAEATAAGLVGLKGHRSVGGIRASIYNACPKSSVEALVAFMKDFEMKHG
jgi:phosphoserine aminotransferase